MGMEMVIEVGKMGYKEHEDIDEDIKVSSEQIQRRIAEDGGETRKTFSVLIMKDGEETRKAMVELGKSLSVRNLEECEHE